jgi:CDP-diacylglycerol--serine O-phosphatidyltransferase
LSLPLIIKNSDSLVILEILTNHWILLLITALSAFILNAEIPLFSLKIKKFSFKENALQMIFLLISILLILIFQFSGIALVIVFYVVLSVITNSFAKK